MRDLEEGQSRDFKEGQEKTIWIFLHFPPSHQKNRLKIDLNLGGASAGAPPPEYYSAWLGFPLT